MAERQERASGAASGLALGGWLGGLQPTGATVRLNPDGSLAVLTGQVDIAGTNIALAQIAASAYGVDIDQVRITTGDTDVAPVTGLSAGSKTIYTVGVAVLQAAEDARRQTLEIAAEGARGLDPRPRDRGRHASPCAACRTRAITLATIGKKGNLYMSKTPPVLGMATRRSPSRRPASRPSSRGIEVDPDTGEVTLHDFVVVQDVGQGHQPAGRRGPDAGRRRPEPRAWR